MSSAFVKSKLKAARDSIQKKDYQAAHDASSQVLDYEPDNYNAKVFLGLSLLELGEVAKSEQIYRSAISLNPKQILAWQGLSKVQERTGKRAEYAETLLCLAKMFSDTGDAVRCAETVQRIVNLQKQSGTSTQIVDALALYLPTSELYHTLTALPPPDPTQPTASTVFEAQIAIHNMLPVLEEITAITEKSEEDTVRREVDNRRKRLNAAGPEEVKREVWREVYSESKLPTLYNDILNHPNTPDELRRKTESKLLRHKQAYFHSLPSSGELSDRKMQLAKEVQELVDGIVLLSIPDELAWTIFIENKDAESIDDYDIPVLKRFITIFPASPLSRFIRAYLIYSGKVKARDEDDDDDSGSEAGPTPDDDDPFNVMLDAFVYLGSSILAHRILSEAYLWELDYANTIPVAEVGLELVRQHMRNTGQDLPLVCKAFDITLAVSLIHLFPPKHHTRALRIIDNVLSQDPENTSSLMGRGYIMQRAENWEEATKMFEDVLRLLPEDDLEAIRAKEERAWCLSHLSSLTIGIDELETVIDVLNSLQGKDEDLARCWWRLGQSHWEMGVEHYETSYNCYIRSLKCLPSFAPAFTSLGIYYVDAALPPDPNRASKCFQKAFELDAREGDAARRLAEGFAEEREWDLVEVVAKRTIEGEGGVEEGFSENEVITASRHLSNNAWAWKAMGVVHLNRQQYSQSIRSFQIALRANTNDQLSWLRLGEAYAKAGRHSAAAKALNRAIELDPDDWVCAYLIGEVQRHTGQFAEAIASFSRILEFRPAEPGVLMSLANTHLDLAHTQSVTGFIGRAEESFVHAVELALKHLKCSAGFRGVAWKTIADALLLLSPRTSFANEDAIRSVMMDIIPLITLDSGSRLPDVFSLPLGIPDPSDSRLKGLDILKIALGAYDYRLTLGLHDTVATGSAWFDFAVALYLLERSFPSFDAKETVHKRAISSVMEAIRAEPGESRYWRAFGDLNFQLRARTAQHAYIRTLEIDDKDVSTWTNLGLLYLYNDDPELANEAFYRAQTLDPDYHLAWVGQGLVATKNGHFADSRILFEHAVSLTTEVPDADLEFARREFKHHSSGRMSTTFDLFPAFFVLGRYCQQRPDDASALHLYGLISERIGHPELAAEAVQHAIAVLEAAYEESEDAALERQFAIANTTAARLRLAAGDYEDALEFYDSAWGMLPEGETGVLNAQCRFGTGLANFKLGRLQGAIDAFEEALTCAGDDLHIRGNVTVLLAQCLWTMGTEEAQESAKTQLLECITTDPENLTAINVLAGMGILTEDDNLVDAALSEVLGLPLDRRNVRDQCRDVTYLLIQQYLEQGDIVRAKGEAQKAVFNEPGRTDMRRALASLVLQTDDATATRALLEGRDSDMDEQRLVLGLRAVAEAEIGSPDALPMAQRAVMLGPWVKKNWEALAYVRSKLCAE
ncbi:TPR-like protein [Vararia minispora EC-137]|uniref:TPR-like protein n=1 Tax=Vararia minispora EC-137 TaxID=1314806 RepID=A0ACB8Q5K8_9AGAM|nr:TPR-like protein [Vararia minispora EC-137]